VPGGEAGAAIVELCCEASDEFGTKRRLWMATEYLQFAGALVFFLGILIGSYWFVYVPRQGGRKGDDEG
jgi:hypothetical protein